MLVLSVVSQSRETQPFVLVKVQYKKIDRDYITNYNFNYGDMFKDPYLFHLCAIEEVRYTTVDRFKRNDNRIITNLYSD